MDWKERWLFFICRGVGFVEEKFWKGEEMKVLFIYKEIFLRKLFFMLREYFKCEFFKLLYFRRGNYGWNKD